MPPTRPLRSDPRSEYTYRQVRCSRKARRQIPRESTTVATKPDSVGLATVPDWQAATKTTAGVRSHNGAAVRRAVSSGPRPAPDRTSGSLPSSRTRVREQAAWSTRNRTSFSPRQHLLRDRLARLPHSRSSPGHRCDSRAKKQSNPGAPRPRHIARSAHRSPQRRPFRSP